MAHQAVRSPGGPVRTAERQLREAEAAARFVMDLPPAAREPDAERMARAILGALDALKEALQPPPGAKP